MSGHLEVSVVFDVYATLFVALGLFHEFTHTPNAYSHHMNTDQDAGIWNKSWDICNKS
jgi:hypothetical protein